MSQAHSDQDAIDPIIPISLFRNVADSGQIRSFADRGEETPTKNRLWVARDQEGQDFPDNADFLHNEPITWSHLVAVLKASFEEPFSKKEDPALFSPTCYQTRMYYNGNGKPFVGFRCKQNATVSGVIFVDAD